MTNNATSEKQIVGGAPCGDPPGEEGFLIIDQMDPVTQFEHRFPIDANPMGGHMDPPLPLLFQLPINPVGHLFDFFMNRRPGMSAPFFDDELHRDVRFLQGGDHHT